MKFQYIFSIIILCFFQDLSSQTRSLQWVHGTGDRAPVMQKYRDAIQEEYRTTHRSSDYNSTRQSVNDIADDIRTQQNNPNIAIGHSLGGLVLRELDRISPNNRADAIITVGSPNRGAPVVTSVRNGTMDREVRRACNTLLAYPFSLIPIKVLKSNAIKNFLCFNFNQIFSVFNGGEQFLEGPRLEQPFTDMAPNSAFINRINNFDTQTPIISIVGEESSENHWRLMSKTLTADQDTWQGGNDDKWRRTAKDVTNAYRIAEITHYALAAGTIWWKPWAGGLNIYRAIQAGRGRKWMQGSQGLHRSLIGSVNVAVPRTHTYTVDRYRECRRLIEFEPDAYFSCIRNCMTSSQGCYYTQTRTYTTFQNFNDDGLLSTHHQTVPGLEDRNIYEAKGINHIEMLDGEGSSFKRPNIEDEMLETYREIFEDRNNGDPFRLQPN